MEFYGVIPSSLNDYKDKISYVLFTKGCNMRCVYCHNVELVIPKFKEKLKKIEEEYIFKSLKKRKKIIDAVVITGGEPTIHNELDDFLKKIKEMGFLVKLDTNGTNPDFLKKIIDLNLLDFIAMDIKASIKKYNEICAVNVNIFNIKKSIEIIKNSNIDYEFRTTVYPLLTLDDFKEIGELINGAKYYSIQQFSTFKTLDEDAKKQKPKSSVFLKQIKKLMENYVLECEIKNIF